MSKKKKVTPMQALMEGFAMGSGIPAAMMPSNIAREEQEAAAKALKEKLEDTPPPEVPLDLGIPGLSGSPLGELGESPPLTMDQAGDLALEGEITELSKMRDRLPPDKQVAVNNAERALAESRKHGDRPPARELRQQAAEILEREKPAEYEIKPPTIEEQAASRVIEQPDGSRLVLQEGGRIDAQDNKASKKMELESKERMAMIEADEVKREAKRTARVAKAQEEQKKYDNDLDVWKKGKFKKQPLAEMVDELQQKSFAWWKKQNPDLPESVFASKYDREYFERATDDRLKQNFDNTRGPQLSRQEAFFKAFEDGDPDMLDDYRDIERDLNTSRRNQYIETGDAALLEPVGKREVLLHMMENSDAAIQDEAAQLRKELLEEPRNVGAEIRASFAPGGTRHPETGQIAALEEAIASPSDLPVETGLPAYGMMDDTAPPVPAEMVMPEEVIPEYNPVTKQQEDFQLKTEQVKTIESLASQRFETVKTAPTESYKKLNVARKKAGIKRSIDSMIPADAIAVSLAAGNANAENDIAEAATAAIKNKTDHFSKLSVPDQQLELRNMIVVPKAHWDTYEFVPGVIYYDDALNRYAIPAPKEETRKEKIARELKEINELDWSGTQARTRKNAPKPVEGPSLDLAELIGTNISFGGAPVPSVRAKELEKQRQEILSRLKK